MMKGKGNEKGETQVGLIVGVIVIGALISAVMNIESCFREAKDEKVRRHREKNIEQMRTKYDRARGQDSYFVKVK